MSRLSGVLLAILALTACIASAPANAFARGGGGHGWGGHFGGFHGRAFGGFRGPVYGSFHGRFVGGYAYTYYGGAPGDVANYAPGCVWARRVVPTPWGLQWRIVPVCYYGY